MDAETRGPAPAADPAQRLADILAEDRADTASAQEGGRGRDDAVTAKSDGQTTTEPPPGQEDDPVAKLTPEQRKRVLAEADPEDVATVNDRFNGYVGKRLQVTRAEQEKIARDQALLGLRQQALAEGDPDKALQALGAMTHAEQEKSHQSAWAEAVGVFTALDANPATKPIVQGLAGRDYGALANGNGTFAALLYKADLAQGVIDHLPAWEEAIRAEADKAAEKRLRPALEREIRARLSGEEPPPDTGSGGAPTSDLPGTLAETRRFVARMSPAEYARRETEIDRHLERFMPRRRAATR